MRRNLTTILGVVALLFVCGSSVFAAVADFSHIDDNPYSSRVGQSLGPYDAANSGAVTMWYNQYNKW